MWFTEVDDEGPVARGCSWAVVICSSGMTPYQRGSDRSKGKEKTKGEIMTQYEHIFHVCGHRQRRRVFGSERIKAEQRKWHQSLRCDACVLACKRNPKPKTPPVMVC